MNKKLIFYIYAFSMFVLILRGANAWFFVDLPFTISMFIKLLIFFIALYYKIEWKVTIGLNVKKCIVIAFFIIAAILSRQITRIASLISFIVTYYPLLVLLSDKNNAQKTLNVITKSLSVIFIPSIIIHLLFSIIGYPPTLPLVLADNDNYYFYNYGILIKNMAIENTGIRFNSIFLEPGYLGTLCSFILYAVKFNFKRKSNIVILFALVLSFSLAGYVITFLGWISLLYSKRTPITKYLIYCIIVIGIFYYSQFYNNGDNFFNNYIFSRLESDKDKGIKGNNRNSELTDFYFNKMCDDGSILLGVGPEYIRKINGGGANDGDYTNQIRGAGYKLYCITNGCLAAVFYLFFYFFLSLKRNKQQSRYCKLFFLLILLTFIQASYPSSFSWLIPYILGIDTSNNLNYENRNINVSCSS